MNGVLTWTLTMSAPIGSGTTDPPTGVYSDILDGTEETITATASAGWGFYCWIVNDTYSGGMNPVTFPMDANYTIFALFIQLPPAHGPDITYDIQDTGGCGSPYGMIGHTRSRSVMTSSTDFDIILAGVGLKTNGAVPTIVTASSYGTGTCDLTFDVPVANTQAIFIVMSGYYDLVSVYEQYHNEWTDLISLTTGDDSYESAYIAFGTLSAVSHEVSATGSDPDAGISIAVYLFPPNSITSYTSSVSTESALWTELDLGSGYNYFIFGAADGEEAIDGIFTMSVPTPSIGGGGANIIASETLTEAQANAQREAQDRITREREKRLQMEQK